jgi:Mg-chelatase subunit ChlI
MPEFSPQALDSLRQPLETGEVSIVRANRRATYPARFMLVAAMNPCRCGHADEPGFACRRGANARCSADYHARISGPLLDRIDLHIEVPAVTAADLILPPPTEGSRDVAERVARARERQAARYAAAGLPHVRSNAAVSGAILEDVARPEASGLSLLREAADAMRLSARGYHRVLRVARTRKLCLSCTGRRSSARGVSRAGATSENRAGRVRSGQPLATLIPPRMPIAAKNSCRVSALSRKTPSMRLVTMVTPGLWMPRVVMH